MSVSLSGSTLCRRLWIKHLCHDIVHSQHTRMASPATKQTQRMLSQVNYQPPPSFLTPTYPATDSTSIAKHNKDLTIHSKKNLEKQILEHVKANQVDRAHHLLGQIYRSGQVPTIATYNHIIKALAKQFQHQQRRIEAHALLDDMVTRGIAPNSQTYMQLLLGYAIHTKSFISTTNCHGTTSKIQLLFDKFIQYERERGFKRTHHKIKKLVEVMAGVGHDSLIPVMTATMDANVKLDVAVWNTALGGCVKGDNLAGAEQLLDIMRLAIVPDATSYHTVIGGYLKNQCNGVVDLDHAIELFQKMMDDRVVADYRIYQDFLCAYTTKPIDTDQGDDITQQEGHDKAQDTLLRLWQAMMTTMTDKQKVGDNVLVTLLDYYLRNQCYSAMEQVYWDLRQRGDTISRRSVIYFHRAISGFANKQHLISGIAMFYDLLAYGHRANHSTTSSLLRACVLRGQLDMAQQILDVMEETLEQLAPVDHYATMVRSYIQQGQLDSANAMFSKVQQLYESNPQAGRASLLVSYQAMIRGYFNLHQGDQAQSLFEQYLQHHTPENNIMDKKLVGIMIEGYGRLGDTRKLDDFCSRPDVTLDDSRTRTILIQSRLDLGDMDGAEHDLKEGLIKNNIRSMRSSIQAVLSGLALNGNVASCEYWVDILTSNDLMDVNSHRALLVCYGQAGETRKLEQAYGNINQQGIKLGDSIENKIKFEWLKSNVQN